LGLKNSIQLKYKINKIFVFLIPNLLKILKNKSHMETDVSGVFKGSKVKRKYRQYMNRRGGFNRSLDKID